MDTDTVILSRKSPMVSAGKFLDRHYTTPDGHRTLLWNRGNWWCWTGSCYVQTNRKEIEHSVWHFANAAKASDKNGNLEPFDPRPIDVNNIVTALEALADPGDIGETPCWLDGGAGRPPAHECAAFANGLLHVPTRTLHEPTPLLFNTGAAAFAYDPDAPEPEIFYRLLDEVFDGDDQGEDALQEYLGLALVADTRYQKALLWQSPKRGAKGTVLRATTAALGKTAICSPTFHSLGERFGPSALIGKNLATVTDMRISRKTDNASASAFVLAVTGEDHVTLELKHENIRWEGRLPTRFVIATNSLPAFSDTSDALVNRFIVIRTKTSFFGREDHGLEAKLQPELPGILNWMLAGYDRLRARGRFVQPASGEEAIAEMEALSNPTLAFVRDRCVTGPGHEVEASRLYASYEAWKRELGGGGIPVSAALFGRNLSDAFPHLGKHVKGRADDRQLVYTGIALRGGPAPTFTVGR